MPRPRFRREPCDCLDCVYPRASTVPTSSDHAAAVLDPPPKCIILFGEGFLQQAPQRGGPAPNDSTVPVAGALERQATGGPSLGAHTSLDVAVCPHLDGVARDGCTGLVALRQGFPGEIHPAVHCNSSFRALRGCRSACTTKWEPRRTVDGGAGPALPATRPASGHRWAEGAAPAVPTC